MPATRKALHAGSWYSSDGTQLRTQLQGFMDNAQSPLVDMETVFANGAKPKGLIGPHAGYRFCGLTSAYAYKWLDKSSYTTVFVLGPCHHAYIEGCGITQASVIKTPIGDLKVDTDIVLDLKTKYEDMFVDVPIDDDEEEHSLEMHFPFIAKTFGTQSIKVVPIMVGGVPEGMAERYGRALAPYLKRDDTFFVISSDFCHWGSRFRFTYYDASAGPIYKSIEKLDRMGMEAIASMNSEKYVNYQKSFKNTICGLNPITVMLTATEIIHEEDEGTNFEFKWLHYSQSNQARDTSDSSVSYASGLLMQSSSGSS